MNVFQVIYFQTIADVDKPRSSETKHHNPDAEKLLAEFMETFKRYEGIFKSDFFKFAQVFIKRIRTEVDTNKPIDDISDVVQKYYCTFDSHLNTAEVYNNLETEDKEELLNFFEKYVMTVLYRLVIITFE